MSDNDIVKYWRVPKDAPCIYLYLGEHYEGGGVASEMWRKNQVEDENGARRTMVIVEFVHHHGTFGYWLSDLQRITQQAYENALHELWDSDGTIDTEIRNDLD